MLFPWYMGSGWMNEWLVTSTQTILSLNRKNCFKLTSVFYVEWIYVQKEQTHRQTKWYVLIIRYIQSDGNFSMQYPFSYFHLNKLLKDDNFLDEWQFLLWKFMFYTGVGWIRVLLGFFMMYSYVILRLKFNLHHSSIL